MLAEQSCNAKGLPAPEVQRSISAGVTVPLYPVCHAHQAIAEQTGPLADQTSQLCRSEQPQAIPVIRSASTAACWPAVTKWLRFCPGRWAMSMLSDNWWSRSPVFCVVLSAEAIVSRASRHRGGLCALCRFSPGRPNFKQAQAGRRRH